MTLLGRILADPFRFKFCADIYPQLRHFICRADVMPGVWAANCSWGYVWSYFNPLLGWKADNRRICFYLAGIFYTTFSQLCPVLL